MSETNREKAFRWMEGIWNQRQFSVIDELFAPNGIGHHEGMETHDVESMHHFVAGILEAFPDIRVEVDHAIEEGDHVVVRWTAHGTHHGNNLGVPATEAEVSFSGMTWMTFDVNGQIIEGWDSWNQGALIQQLAQAALVR
ncbi:MAG: ester cyclase [Luteolibacter sp.]